MFRSHISIQTPLTSIKISDVSHFVFSKDVNVTLKLGPGPVVSICLHSLWEMTKLQLVSTALFHSSDLKHDTMCTLVPNCEYK